MFNNKKEGFITLEIAIVVALTFLLAIGVIYGIKNKTKEGANNVGKKVAQTETYMGQQIKEAYTSDYGGADLDEGWASGGGEGIQGGTVPIYKLVEKISTANREYSIRVGEEIPIGVNVYPTNATQQKLSWKVITGKDKTMITRDNNGHSGTILGLKSGRTAIRISATDGSGIDTVLYVLVEQPVTGLKLDKEGQNINLSYSGTGSTVVRATVLPSTGDSVATNKRVSWEFGNGGTNSECFIMTPNHSNNSVNIRLAATSLENYCAGKSITIYGITDDGGYRKQFTVTSNK